MTVLAVIDRAFDEQEAPGLLAALGGDLGLVVFTASHEHRGGWLHWFAGREVAPILLPIEGALDEIAQDVQGEYIAYLDSLRHHPALQDGQDRPLRLEGAIAYWWLHECSTHRSDVYPDYTRYLQLKLIAGYVERHAVRKVVVVSADPRFVDAVRYSLDRCEVLAAPGNRLRRGLVSANLFRLARHQVRWFLRAILCVALLKWQVSARKPQSAPVQWGLYSSFPNAWKGFAFAGDARYAGLVKRIGEKGESYRHFFSIVSDGLHQNLSFRQTRQVIKQHRAILEAHIVIDHWSTAGDCFRFLVQAVQCWLILWTSESRLRRLRHKDRQGIDITAYLLEQNYGTALRVPRALWEGRKLARCLDACKVDHFVYYLYEWTIGRAMLYQIRRAMKLHAVGMQHGPVNPRRLYCVHDPKVLRYSKDADYMSHMPHPDEVWLEDETALATLARSGYPLQVLKIVESRNKVSNCKSAVRLPLQVVILPTLWDGGVIFHALLDILRQENQYWSFAFKPHPRSNFTAEVLAQRIKEHRIPALSIWRGMLDETIANADIVVGTISSALEEAYACRKKVVLLLLPNRYNESALYGSEGVEKVTSCHELLAVFKREADKVGANFD